jgi:hypothetical protein
MTTNADRATRALKPAGRWPLGRLRSEGPQHVTVHGCDEVVLVRAEKLRRLHGGQTDQALMDAIQGSPHRDIDLTPPRGLSPARDARL